MHIIRVRAVGKLEGIWKGALYWCDQFSNLELWMLIVGRCVDHHHGGSSAGAACSHLSGPVCLGGVCAQ